MAIPFESWQSAISTVMIGAGDPYVIAMPTSSVHYPWVVVRGVVPGSFYIPPDAPFVVESYDAIDLASARFGHIEQTHCPLLLTSVDGRKLVVFLREPEQPRHRPSIAGR